MLQACYIVRNAIGLPEAGEADLILQGFYADAKYNVNQRPHNPSKQEGGTMSHIKST